MKLVLNGAIAARLEAGLARLEAKFDATIPRLATKEQVGKLPTHGYLWGVLGVLVKSIFGAFAAHTVLH